MKFSLQRAHTIPLYQQLVEQLREYIRSGALPVGARLPTVRQLATEYGLTRPTVHTAYMELQAEGFIESIVGRGTFVCSSLPVPTGLDRTHVARAQPPPEWLSQGMLADMMRMAEQSEMISFAQIMPAIETYPIAELNRAMRSAFDTPASLGYGLAQGELILRAQIAHLLLDRGIVTSLLITAGAQQGLDVTLRACTTPDDILLVEEPTFVGMLELAALRRQHIVSIPMDYEGIQLGPLEEACKRYHPRLLYLIPTFQNPSGISLALERQQAILDLARRYDFYILEDDIYGLLAHDKPAPLPLKAIDTDERVIYLFSFSKTVMPALRLGAVVADSESLQQLIAVKRSSDLLCSPLLQHTLAHYLKRHQLQAHIQRIQPLYRERKEAMLEALDHYLLDCSWSEPEGGLCIWVSLPEQVNERDLYLACIKRGIGIAPGSAFSVQPDLLPAMRLSFSSNEPACIWQGIALFSKILEEQLRHPGTFNSGEPMRKSASGWLV
jgi:2-aminoadipate transaminase